MLRDAVANYSNVLIYIDKKTKDTDSLEDQEKQLVHTQAEKVRYYSQMCYYHISSLPKIDEKQIKRAKDFYTKIKKEYIPKLEDSENYVIQINTILNNLLVDIQDHLSDYAKTY
ncbi:MAG: hypothetical protein ACOC80_15955 [Petrotogales bacterium]